MGDPQMKGKALPKDSIVLLLDLISKHKIIVSKLTNATSNKQKEEAWRLIAHEFSGLTGDYRRPEQLRLKWENLKKSARRRRSLIRMNKLEVGIDIPPDKILDRVASILGASHSDMSAGSGDDGADEASYSEALVGDMDTQPLDGVPNLAETSPVMVLLSEGDGGVEAEDGDGGEPTNERLIKRRKRSEELLKAQRDKNLKMAAYFKAMTEKVLSDKRKIELETRKLELENRRLELENQKYELERKIELENKKCKQENGEVDIEKNFELEYRKSESRNRELQNRKLELENEKLELEIKALRKTLE